MVYSRVIRKGQIMTIEQTVEIPESHRVYVDIPPEIPAGKARIAINIFEYSGVDIQQDEKRKNSPLELIEAFSDEDEATEFATRLSMRMLHETR
jgi:hypothetical protein